MKKAQKKKNKKVKTERSRMLSKLPCNYHFWKFTVDNPKEMEEFLKRGSQVQKNNIKRVLNYMKLYEIEEFEKIDGKKWIKKFKK